MSLSTFLYVFLIGQFTLIFCVLFLLASALQSWLRGDRGLWQPQPRRDWILVGEEERERRARPGWWRYVYTSFAGLSVVGLLVILAAWAYTMLTSSSF